MLYDMSERNGDASSRVIEKPIIKIKEGADISRNVFCECSVKYYAGLITLDDVRAKLTASGWDHVSQNTDKLLAHYLKREMERYDKLYEYL